MFRCAIVSDAELAQLRRVTRVVRMGHVTSIEPGRILLEGGELPITPQQVIVHCSADGIPRMQAQPIFQGPRIKLQYVRLCQPTFSGAFVAHVEAMQGSDDEKNALCRPVPIPDVPADWLTMQLETAQNSYRWSQSPELQKWLYGARLDGYSAMFAHATRQAAPDRLAIIDRYLKAIGPGTKQLGKLVAAAAGRRALAG